MESKTHLRQQLKEQRRTLSKQEQEEAARKLGHSIQLSGLLRPNIHIGTYLAAAGELSLSEVFNLAWLQHCRCYLPIIQPDAKMGFAPYSPTSTLTTNRYNILEPENPPTKTVTAEAFDILLLPLVAVDLSGHRLGQGKGYYDRHCQAHLTHANKPLLVGVAYDFQVLDFVPSEAHDVRLDAILTPTTLHHCEGS